VGFLRALSGFVAQGMLIMTTGGKFAVAGQQIAGASENFVLNY
jgi:hypothetical protein